MANAWSDWQVLAGVGPFAAEVFAEIVDGGQAFRWHRQADATWLGIWGEQVVRVRLTATGSVEWSAPANLVRRVAAALPQYFAVSTPFDTVADQLPWRSDPHLAACVQAFPGLRLLRQPFGETLLGFLCSATKQIVQIKQMVALLAERHGARLCTVALPSQAAESRARRETDLYRLPTWEELAIVPEPKLRECLLGFRARYISETARFLASHPGWLAETEAAPYAVAKARLCELPGVGEKVADCVLLFGAGRLEAFPVDVWILKTMAARYGLDGWKPAQLVQFGRQHFGAAAGFAQQFLFAWERRESRLARTKDSL
jgi:N-glycosylase/DNA lyase